MTKYYAEANAYLGVKIICGVYLLETRSKWDTDPKIVNKRQREGCQTFARNISLRSVFITTPAMDTNRRYVVFSLLVQEPKDSYQLRCDEV